MGPVLANKKDSNMPEPATDALGEIREKLIPIARRVFWWGNPEEWVQNSHRLAAQVMTYGDWEDTTFTLEILGDEAFQNVLRDPPPGVFDLKSWTFWHVHYHMPAVPPLPIRKL